jgi:hypothetical protein
MPRATVDSAGVRHDLKTCEGGYVLLRQLPFGMMLKRRDLAAKYMQEFTGTSVADVNTITINILNEKSRQFDFANAILDHNLEDENGNKLDFGNSMALDVLDPRIAAEIETLIDKLNGTEFNEENFTTPSEQSLTEIGNGSQTVEESRLTMDS